MKKSKALLILFAAIIVFGGAAVGFIGLTHQPTEKTHEIPLNAATFFPAN